MEVDVIDRWKVGLFGDDEVPFSVFTWPFGTAFRLPVVRRRFGESQDISRGIVGMIILESINARYRVHGSATYVQRFRCVYTIEERCERR